MKRIVILAALLLPIAGCAKILALRDQLADPKSAQALAVAKGWAQIVTCQVANLSSVAGKIESAVSADKAIVDTTGKVFTVSSLVCQLLGGTVTGLQTVQ